MINGLWEGNRRGNVIENRKRITIKFNHNRVEEYLVRDTLQQVPPELLWRYAAGRMRVPKS